MPQFIEDFKSEILRAQRSGDYLKEYDLSQVALEISPNDEFFQYCSVLALARCNAKQRALDSFYSYNLNQSENEYVRALEPRILKDLAFLDTDKEKFRLAAVTYHKAFRTTGGHYSAINAATLYLLCGDLKQAFELAQAAVKIARLDQGPQYFPLTTHAEACILLNQPEEAGNYIQQAAKYNDNNLLTRARTHYQLRLICKHLGLNEEILDPLLPETVIHYTGHIFDQYRSPTTAEEEQIAVQIDKLISQHYCAVAYGSLAAGSDIMFAEAILKQGGELNIWLPFAMENFCDVLVRPAGNNWEARFYNCISKANSVSCATESRFLGEEYPFKFCSDVVMGMAIMRANSLNTKHMQLAVWDEIKANPGSGGTYSNIEKWQKLGNHTEIIPCPAKLPPTFVRKVKGNFPEDKRESHAILFADVRGFGKLSDLEILWFYNELEPVLAEAIKEFRPEILHLDTWGDSIFLVTDKASTAARIAVALDHAITKSDQSSLKLDAPLLMRIGLHFGPAYRLYDHLAQCYTYSSNDVTKASRIEPVTPPGEIFGTEPFVAMLELEGAGWANFVYAGTIPSAKNFGAFRMFHIRPR
jgi:class 3 adenylate cyclase